MYQRTTMIEFQVVDLRMSYTIILQRPFLRKTKAVESVNHLKLKSRVDEGIGVVRGD